MSRTPSLRVGVLLAAVLAGLMGGASNARADPITITGGHILIAPGLQGPGTMDLIGTRGFSVTGQLGTGRVDPRVCFPCEPGTPISVGAAWSGLDLLGMVATLEGVTYPQVGGANSPNQLAVELSGAAVAPAFVAGSPVTLTAPFTLEGIFFHAQELFGPVSTETLMGSGIATLTLQPLPRGENVPVDLWQYGGVRFDFTADTQPIPEPATLLLLGSGLAFISRHALRRAGKPK